MCSHYEGVADPKTYTERFRTHPPTITGKVDLWPGYLGVFIRKHPHADVGDDAVPEREGVNGIFGLVPHWAEDLKLARSTYNARTETVATKPSFRDAWRKSRHCIIPAAAFYEPDWRSGKGSNRTGKLARLELQCPKPPLIETRLEDSCCRPSPI